MNTIKLIKANLDATYVVRSITISAMITSQCFYYY